MPKGNPKPQTRATMKYEEKIGMMAKTYKLKREVAEEFAKTCEKIGSNQSRELTKLMTKFIEDNK